MIELELVPHPHGAHPDIAIRAQLTASRYLDGTAHFYVRYVLTGDIDSVLIPRSELAEPHDELWKTTCFEAFIQPEGDAGYYEFNVSPKRWWSLYRFDDYRQGMRRASEIKAPGILASRFSGDSYHLGGGFGDPLLQAPGRMGLSAVIEAKDGTKSYWALAHPAGPPDFHNADCFVARLPAPDRA